MLKFLRKYNKWIMVVGGSLLMIAFLAPQAIQQLPRLRDPVVGELDGKVVKASMVEEADKELRAVNALGGLGGGLADMLLGLSAPSSDRYIEWFLLTREAENAGFVGSDADGFSLYPQIARELAVVQAQRELLAMGYPSSMVQQFAPQHAQSQGYAEAFLNRLLSTESGAAGSAGFRSIEELHVAVAKLRGVLRMKNAYLAMSRLSSSRATRAGAQTLDATQVDYVVIPATRFIDAVPEPTEEEIAAHFEKYADKLPSETEYGIGYRQPMRVKLEWLAIERAPIENAITIDPVEASKHQQLNKDRFPNSFTADRAGIEAELKRQKAEQIVSQAENYVRAEILQATRTLQRRDGYVVLPEDWASQRPSLESIAQHVVDQVAEANDGLRIPLPSITIRNSEWLTMQDVSTLPGFSGSRLRVGSIDAPAVLAVFSIPELQENPQIPVQIGLLASEYPTTGNDGTKYFFRVLDARTESAPETLDEVREDVVRDLKRIEAYGRVVNELGAYTEVAINAGLEEVVEAVNAGLPEDSEDPESVSNRVSITEGVTLRSRVGQATPPIFRDEDVLGAVTTVAKPLDPTRKIEDIPLPERTFAAPAPKSLAVVVGRVSGLMPLTKEDFATGYGQIASLLTQLEVSDLEDAPEDPFSFENLKKRHGWVNRDPRRQSSSGDADESDAGSSSGS